MLPIAPIVLLLRLLAERRSGGQALGGGEVENGRYLLWSFVLLGWCCLLLFGAVAAIDFVIHETPEKLRSAALLFGIALVFAPPLLFPFPLLHRLARTGHHRLVYYLAHLFVVFAKRGETHAAASLLSGLALAYRGGATRSELEWLLRRISTNQGILGTAGAAYAVYGALSANLSRREGRRAEADDLAQTARILLGTMTYLSPIGAPKPVMKIAFELLGCDDARRGHWGALLLAPWEQCTKTLRIFRAYVKTRLEKSDDNTREVQRALALAKKSKSPFVEALFARVDEPPPPSTVNEARQRAVQTYLSLARNEAVGPRTVVNMLATFDVVTHPEFPENVLSDEVKADPEAIDAFHESVADALAAPIAKNLIVPLYALAPRGFGPVSARVYQKVETALFGELERAIRAIDERCDHHLRRDPFGEWLEVSQVRSIYRRIRATLGDDAARHVWPVFCRGYCRLGVQLSETWPRMRPLAHAVFKVLHSEAVRFEDAANIEQQAHNVAVTSGLG